MTYTVFSGTLNPTQSIKPLYQDFIIITNRIHCSMILLSTHHNSFGQQVFAEEKRWWMAPDGDLAITDVNGISREQPQKPMKLIKQVRPSNSRDGIDRSIDGSLQGEPVGVQLGTQHIRPDNEPHTHTIHISCTNSLYWHGHGARNTAEENSSIFCLIQMS